MAEQGSEPSAYETIYETAKERDFGTEKDDVKAYAKVGGTAAATAACAATGYGVAVAAACGYVGGEIAGFLVETFWGNDEEQARIHAEQAAQWAAWDQARAAWAAEWKAYTSWTIRELEKRIGIRLEQRRLGHKKSSASLRPDLRERMAEVNWPPAYVVNDPIMQGIDWSAQNWQDELNAFSFWLEWPLLEAAGATPTHKGSLDAGKVTGGAWKAGLPIAEQRFEKLASDFRGAFLYATAPDVGEYAAKQALKKQAPKRAGGGAAIVVGAAALGGLLLLSRLRR